MTNQRLRGGWLIAPEIRGSTVTTDWPVHIPEVATPAPVPGIIQQALPEHHGLTWYWRQWVAPTVRPDQRILMTFEAVDYTAAVWINGVAVGQHEGGETPFTFDVTDTVRPGTDNLLALRVLNPTTERIDGMILEETPHANKAAADFWPGRGYNSGGIVGEVCSRVVPEVSIEGLTAFADWRTGQLTVSLQVLSHRTSPEDATLQFSVREDRTGVAVAAGELGCVARPGRVGFEATLGVPDFQSWDIDDPWLYSVEARISLSGVGTDSAAVKTGFRLFEIRDGYFQLNGRRIYLRSTHTGNHYPLGQKVPPLAGMRRQDLVYAKASGFNTVRYIAGLAHPDQLAFCDEIGLLVYEETAAAWLLGDSPEMKARFDRSLQEMILRDRNHPSVVIWGLLNETRDGPVFRRAVASLPLVRSLDRTRVVALSSGRWDADLAVGSVCNPDRDEWEYQWGAEHADAAITGARPDGPDRHAYVPGAGDIHFYPENPETPEVWELLRTLGAGEHPVLLSEYGAGSLFDAVTETASAAGHTDGVVPPDLTYVQSMATRFAADWRSLGMDSVYAHPEDTLRDSQAHQARRRASIFSAIRSNPQIAGYNLTGMLDHALTGEGSWTFWRRWKPGALDVLVDGWAPLRWCISIQPPVTYPDRGVTVDVRLAHEVPLPPGSYPVSLVVMGPAGQRREYTEVVLSPGPGSDALAEPVLTVPIGGPLDPGPYRLSTSMGDRAAPAAGRAEFHVLPRPQRQLDGRSAVAVGLDDAERRWLAETGVSLRDNGNDAASLVVIGHCRGEASAPGAIEELSAGGRPVLVLSPWEFLNPGENEGPLPIGLPVSCSRLYDWLYHKDCFSKRHPVFDKLPGPGLMDWDVYGPVTPRYILHGAPPQDVAAAAFAVGYPRPGGYDAGPVVATYMPERGPVVVSCLDILGQLGLTPVADHLAVNLLRYAASLSPPKARRP